MGLLVITTVLTLLVAGDGLPLGPRPTRNNSEFLYSGTEHNLPEFDVVVSNRGYAYMMALLVMGLFGAFIYCHVASIRKTRLLEQYEQQGTLPEWSPLLITTKNMRPPPPYEQVV